MIGPDTGWTVARAALVVLLLAVSSGPGSAAPEPVCRPVTHEDARFVVCTADLRRQTLRLFWKAPDGAPYQSLSRLVDSAPAGTILAATNAGMYDPDLSPVGLFVQDGKQVKAASTRDGEGNFNLKPNGVFYVARGRAGILETGAYLQRHPAAELATQSGPMLVIDGALHPQFSENGPSRKIRNGVGVRDPHTVLFAISDEPVSFGTFARLFRDTLGCRNALFLDGSISSLYAPDIGRRDVAPRPLGPLIAIVAETPVRAGSARAVSATEQKRQSGSR